MLCIISCCANRPEVRLHGLLTSRLILLGEEVSLVGGHVHEVDCTLLDSACYSCETGASLCLISANRRGAVVLTNHVDAGAIRVGGSRYAVRRQKRVAVLTVRSALFGALAQQTRLLNGSKTFAGAKVQQKNDIRKFVCHFLLFIEEFLFNLYTLCVKGLTFALDKELTVNDTLNSLCINSGVVDGGGTTIGLY